MSDSMKSLNTHLPGKLAAVILSGGRSSRWDGADKGLQQFDGQPMIGIVTEILRPQVDRIVLSINRNVSEYATFGFQCVTDRQVDNVLWEGPMAGIKAALEAMRSWPDWSDFTHVLVCTCDSPLLPSDYVAVLQQALIEENASLAVVFDGQRQQNLHCLMAAGLAKSLIHEFTNGMRAMHHWHQLNNAVSVDFSANKNAFINVNSPAQIESSTR